MSTQENVRIVSSPMGAGGREDNHRLSPAIDSEIKEYKEDRVIGPPRGEGWSRGRPRRGLRRRNTRLNQQEALISASNADSEAKENGLADALKQLDSEDQRLYVVPEAYDVGFGVDKISYIREMEAPNAFRVVGTIKIKDVSFDVNCMISPLPENVKVSGYSDCRLFALAKDTGCQGEKREKLYANDDKRYPLFGGPKERLRRSAHMLIDRYMTPKMTLDKYVMIAAVRKNFMYRDRKMSDLDGEIEAILREDWVVYVLENSYRKAYSKFAYFTSTVNSLLGLRYSRLMDKVDGLNKWRLLWEKSKIVMKLVSAVMLFISRNQRYSLLGWFWNSLPNGVSHITRGATLSAMVYKFCLTYYRLVKQQPLDFFEETIIKTPWVPCSKTYGTRNGSLTLSRNRNVPVFIPKTVFSRDDFPPMDITHSLTALPVDPTPNKRVEVIGSVIKGVPLVYPANGQEDLEAALRIRMAFHREIDQDEWSNFRNFFMKEAISWGKLTLSPQEPRDFIVKQWPGARGKAIVKYVDEDMEDEDRWCDIFVKGEVYLGKTEGNYKPRMIWSRSLRFLAVYGSYFNSVTEELKKILSFGSNKLYVAGCTPDQVGKFGSAFDAYTNIFECDVSNWDGSMHKGFLELETWFIENCLSELPPQWPWLKRNWYKVWGRGQGLTYCADGGRRSGDLWTSAFNSLINVMLTMYVMRGTLKDGNLIMVNGDDNVVATNKNIDENYLVGVYALLGLKLEVVRHDFITDASFCSGRFYNNGGNIVWSNMPFRLLSKFVLNHHNHDPSKYWELINATAKSSLSVTGILPIVGSIMRTISRSCDERGIGQYREKDDTRHKIVGGPAGYPCSDTYEQFALIYGIGVESIMAIEHFIEENLTIEMFPIQWNDSRFLHGALVDLDVKEMDDADYYTSVTVLDPEREEKWKIERAQEVGLLCAVNELADAEIMAGSPNYVRYLHLLFSFLSSINLEAGITLHQSWNRFALNANMAVCANKKRIRKKKNAQKAQQPQAKDNTPALKKYLKSLVKTALTEGGGALGAAIGGTPGYTMGRMMGSSLSKIVGSGDYKISQNSLLSSSVPSFGNGGRVVRLTHKEFMGDVTGSVAFSYYTYKINPGLSTFSPWLAPIAGQFEQWRIKGMIFEFVSTSAESVGSTNTALGTVIMSFNYNCSKSAFTSKQEAEMHMFSVSGKPTLNMVHAVECESKEKSDDLLYVRVGSLPATENPHDYDYGTFQLSVVGMQAAATVGELWVSYDIELLKPQIDNGLLDGLWARVSSGAYTVASNVLGTANPVIRGNLPMTITSTGGGNDTISIADNITAGRIVVIVRWLGTAAALVYPVITATNLTGSAVFQSNAASLVYTPVAGVSSVAAEIMACYTIDGYRSGGSTLAFGLAGTLPTASTNVDIMVLGIDVSDTPF